MLCLPLSTRPQREQAFPWHHKASWGEREALGETAKPSDHARAKEAGDKGRRLEVGTFVLGDTEMGTPGAKSNKSLDCLLHPSLLFTAEVEG